MVKPSVPWNSKIGNCYYHFCDKYLFLVMAFTKIIRRKNLDPVPQIEHSSDAVHYFFSKDVVRSRANTDRSVTWDRYCVTRDIYRYCEIESSPDALWGKYWVRDDYCKADAVLTVSHPASDSQYLPHTSCLWWGFNCIASVCLNSQVTPYLYLFQVTQYCIYVKTTS